jgi:hypothetical protein
MAHVKTIVRWIMIILLLANVVKPNNRRTRCFCRYTKRRVSACISDVLIVFGYRHSRTEGVKVEVALDPATVLANDVAKMVRLCGVLSHGRTPVIELPDDIILDRVPKKTGLGHECAPERQRRLLVTLGAAPLVRRLACPSPSIVSSR